MATASDLDDVHGLTFTRSVIQKHAAYPPSGASFASDSRVRRRPQGEAGRPYGGVPYRPHHPKYWNDPRAFDSVSFSPRKCDERAKYSLPSVRGGKPPASAGRFALDNTLARRRFCAASRPEFLRHPCRIIATVTLTPENGRLPFRICPCPDDRVKVRSQCAKQRANDVLSCDVLALISRMKQVRAIPCPDFFPPGQTLTEILQVHC